MKAAVPAAFLLQGAYALSSTALQQQGPQQRCAGSAASAPPPSLERTAPKWLTLRGGLVKGPVDLYENAVALGEKKAATTPLKIAILSFISGCHIAFGGLLAVAVGGNLNGLFQTNAGLQKLVFGMFGLPFGLYMVLVAGGELFTGNTALVTAALLEKRATPASLAKNWGISYIGNFVGAMAVVQLVQAARLVPATPFVAALAVKKLGMPFMTTFFRGVICNWMVCMAVWVAAGCSSLVSKYLAIVLPVTAFVVFGAEHSVANMFLIPMGMASGADVSWLNFLLKNLLPVTLGNIVGGALCQAGLYALVYGSVLK